MRHRCLALFSVLALWLASATTWGFDAAITVAELPPEARQTLRLIEAGGPFPHGRDGIVFGNYEKRLPLYKRGYYREYTVRTPGIKGRGPRRIVAGNGGERYYSADHYQSFRSIRQ